MFPTCTPRKTCTSCHIVCLFLHSFFLVTGKHLMVSDCFCRQRGVSLPLPSPQENKNKGWWRSWHDRLNSYSPSVPLGGRTGNRGRGKSYSRDPAWKLDRFQSLSLSNLLRHLPPPLLSFTVHSINQSLVCLSWYISFFCLPSFGAIFRDLTR